MWIPGCDARDAPEVFNQFGGAELLAQKYKLSRQVTNELHSDFGSRCSDESWPETDCRGHHGATMDHLGIRSCQDADRVAAISQSRAAESTKVRAQFF